MSDTTFERGPGRFFRSPRVGVARLAKFGSRFRLTVAMTLVFGWLPSVATAKSSCIDLSLVLAIDASSSITNDEYRLQMDGAAAALRSPEVQAALKRAGHVAIAAVVWSSDRTQKYYAPWTMLQDRQGIEKFAEALEAMPRPTMGDTGLGAGLEAALRMLGTGPCAARQIINVSGDGRETPLTRYKRKSLTPVGARDAATEAGIEINALAISDEESDLRTYFESNVITGPDAFVVEIDSFNDIKNAFLRKLVHEISPKQVSGVMLTSQVTAR